LAEVLAGFICGFALSLISTPLLAVWLVRSRENVAFVQRALRDVPVLLVSIPAANAAFFVWTALGILFGMMLVLTERATSQGGLGSPNLLFTLIILAIAVVIFLPPLVMVPSARRLVLFLAVCFVGLFGWATPYLAQIGPGS
jgi:hypothetical protein